jgi:hypothetical protein
MSDHDTPRSLLDRSFDLTDLYTFPSPEHTDRLVLALNVYPGAGTDTRFSEGARYRFVVRSATLPLDGRRSSFDIGTDEWVITVKFDAPGVPNGNRPAVQEGTITFPNGSSAPLPTERMSEAEGARVFAGIRGDSSFINIPGYAATAAAGRLDFPEHGRNVTDRNNVLSLVVELDPARFLRWSPGTMLAVAGEVVTDSKVPVRVERIGRAIFKNLVLTEYGVDALNSDIDLRGVFNEEDPFDLGTLYLRAYRARVTANLQFLDSLDGKIDWPLYGDGTHPLTELLLGDFQVVDPAKPFAENSYLEIERALLSGRNPETSGGRPINDDASDILATLIYTGGNGPAIDDGVDGATTPASRTFPYLAEPNTDPPVMDHRPLFPSRLSDQLALLNAAGLLASTSS